MASMTEKTRLCDFLVGEVESPPRFSREAVIIEQTTDPLPAATVIGKITKDIPSDGTADPANTGNGTCSDVDGGIDTQIGTYSLECIEAAADGGTFRVTAPNGETLPDAKVGQDYVNPQIRFKISDGATDFAVGDKFTITIGQGSGKVRAIDFAATDGSQDAYGILIADYDPTGGDVEGVALVRDCAIVPDALVWPAGATEGQKERALAQLAAAGIITRTAA